MPRLKTKLSHFPVQSFKDGSNSFPGSKTAIKDTEIPGEAAQNVEVTDVGSISKRMGSARWGGELVSGKAAMGGGVLKTSSLNEVIVAVGTVWKNHSSSGSSALTGVTFTADKRTHFAQAFDKLYGANNTDALAYTANGTSITSISANGNIGDWPVFFNQRIYMTNATYKDRVYYSNPYELDLSDNPPTLTGFSDANMFNTALGDTPPKNAGYIVLAPGSGVEITRLFYDSQAGNEYLFAYTKQHGIWRIAFSDVNQDGSIAHTVATVVTAGGSPSGESVGKFANDQWYFGGDNYYSLGEQAQYQNIRRSTKSGRIRTEMRNIPAAGKSTVAFGQYQDKIYIAYRNGTYNDRISVYDTVLNAWSPPWTNINANFFLNYVEDDGTERFLIGSSNSADSYIYEIETGTDDEDDPVNSYFETKSYDCELPGIIKRFAFIDVFYGSIYGSVTYEVFIDEVSSVTGSVQVGSSTDTPSGFGSRPFGSFPLGGEFDDDTTFATLQQNNNFRIPVSFTSGKKISVKFSNNNSNEQFKINGMMIWYKPGNPWEETA